MGKPPPVSGGGAAADDGAGARQGGSSGGGGADGGQAQRPPPGALPEKKATTRAERRAVQEAARAAKAAREAAATAGGGSGGGAAGGASAAAAGGGKGGGGDRASARAASAAGTAPSGGGGPDGAGGGAPAPSAAPPNGGGGAGGDAHHGRRHAGAGKGGKHAGACSTELFAHLQQYRRVTVEGVLAQSKGEGAAGVHPAIVGLALRYADSAVSGGTARCVAMIHALAQLICDYRTPPGKSLPRDLMAAVNAAVDFLVRCRPLGVSMGNAVKYVKLCISRTDPNAPEDAAKEGLLKQLEDFIQEKVVLADQVLVSTAVSKIYDGDVIMVYGYSQVVLEVLLAAHGAGIRFRVVVVDSRPECEGRLLLRRLLAANMAVTYTLLSGLSYAIKEVTKLILGAAAVLSNGTVMSRAGSALVATVAAAAGKPVLVCCEALKFHERVQLDSITHNELGDPGVLARLPPGVKLAGGDDQAPADGGSVASPPLAGWESVPRLGLLNLKYDATPADCVTMVVCEFGMIPPSSVPVILREWGAKMEEGGP
ncbi:MAG: hypothetical protein J3K34DRAFT_384198 [Monoraphidium minutum]|nr:MAG: hypothetical protein J3K34DRAFT_384198 [Monoraphidium minutum]